MFAWKEGMKHQRSARQAYQQESFEIHVKDHSKSLRFE